MNTMNRCPTLAPLWRCALIALCTTAGALTTAHAQEQAPSTFGAQIRTFPDNALRGKVAFTTGIGTAEINGSTKLITAPGFRLFSPENRLIMQHAVQGQTFTVNYVIEPSTGMLHTVWILTQAEVAQPRKGANLQRNFDFASERQSQ
jgi:hypothetical protein